MRPRLPKLAQGRIALLLRLSPTVVCDNLRQEPGFWAEAFGGVRNHGMWLSVACCRYVLGDHVGAIQSLSEDYKALSKES